ncbi:glycoside hydrolase family 3 C-terminal domain-containing protein [Saccharibacillus sp. CPCC 101409]|uniref:glycoside hydrolase family 3 C-terminal domain-containing protein n=1 Tax=Saccharibacillus sp. CPCC 101409 TaxID=3058041 RepID=UPI002673BCEA|nr:glycoside hydrolase family 3 C-terminal domain-containing protein [Saccharibacillus sp. CPCC 101409]MDO3409325.1 glycoside hydrolase family 3 C-terminal domain-containing protein [Saccharibacillus sp. CPCC 101409]
MTQPDQSSAARTPDLKQLIAQMTLEEKADLCSGKDFWHTRDIERLGIPSIMMTDGPHGLRKQAEGADHLGLSDSVPATCFPSAAGIASSWDRKLITRMGEALGEECQAENVAILLGPGANIKRSPLCGRNFEYFSEDPYLSAEIAASHIRGVQSRGVGTSLKHFAVNNQEHRRMSVDAIVDERTLREIYLASFEGAVKQGRPWTVMSSYNRVNGTYASENEILLSDILKEEWGLEGFVVSDWGAVNERADGLAAGLELEMPSSGGIGAAKIAEAVGNGSLPEKKLDAAVERILRIVFRSVEEKVEHASYDKEQHHRLAREVASESMVLLKNENGILPLKRSGRIAVIGELAKRPRYQGGGSSHIKPTKLDNIYDEFAGEAGEAQVSYADGYKLKGDKVDENAIAEAVKLARESDVTVLFAGLPDAYESEGYDRSHLRLPDNQLRLIEELTRAGAKLVVVLSNGSPVEMPWLGGVKGLLEAYLGGQALGGAIADLLFGAVSPSGKLAETFPMRLEDTPAFLNFPGNGDRVEYREGIYVGYRYYDKKAVEPLFPFGFGLSYTTFAYSDLKLGAASAAADEGVEVSVKVTNTGGVKGKEVAQLYVRDVESAVDRPQRELKGFEKVELEPGESTTVYFALDRRAFAYYDVQKSGWRVESGVFEVSVGSSSRELALTAEVQIEGDEPKPEPIHRNSLIGDLMQPGRLSPEQKALLDDFLRGGLFTPPAEDEAPAGTDGEEDDEHDEQGNAGMMEAVGRYLPLRAAVGFAAKPDGERKLGDLLEKLNG